MPHAGSQRMVVLVSLLFGMVMYTSYSAVLVSRLTVGRPPVPFPTLDSIAEKETHSLCVQDSNIEALGPFLKVRGKYDDELQPRWRSIVNQPPCKGFRFSKDGKCSVCMSLCQDKTVLLEMPIIFAHWSFYSPNSEPCDYIRVTDRIAFSYASFLVNKHFKHTKLINSYLLKLHTFGVIEVLRKRWFIESMRQSSRILQPPTYTISVTFGHIREILKLYATIICITLILLLLELFLGYYKSYCKHARKL